MHSLAEERVAGGCASNKRHHGSERVRENSCSFLEESKMDGGARVNSCRKSKQMILDREGWSSVLSVLVVPASNKCKRHCQATSECHCQ
jgi:hypothetical protein